MGERQRLQTLLDARSHANQLMAMPHQDLQIALLACLGVSRHDSSRQRSRVQADRYPVWRDCGILCALEPLARLMKIAAI
jgi:hypothetical protein